MDGELCVIDPGEDISRFIKDPVVVLVTHGHCDHISGIPELKVKKLYISAEDVPMLTDPVANLSRDLMDHPVKIELPWEDIDKHFRTLKAPGHTLGSRFIVFDGVVFTGDTVFVDTIGRTDLGGSKEKMKETLIKVKEFFEKIPKEWIVFPGHGEPATVKDVLRRNIFLRGNLL
ncbi:MBL fold metallo-hydrolase [Thermotoga sp. KOL6]|nr:MBL fold metallo-hydrolase [Thermotoga sp. KOL6]